MKMRSRAKISGQNDNVTLRRVKPKIVRSRAFIARWPFENEKVLIELMHEQFLQGELVSSTFSTEVWEKICAKLNELLAPNYSYQVMQLKGKFCRVRKTWRLFNHLVTNETGYSWDNERGALISTPEHIAQWIADHPEDTHYMDCRLPHYELCAQMFQNNATTGSAAKSSQQPVASQEKRRCVSEYVTEGSLNLEKVQGSKYVDEYVDITTPCEEHENGANSTTAESHGAEEPDEGGGSSSRRRRKASPEVEIRNTILSTLQKWDEVKLARTGPRLEESIKDCLEALRRMDGLPQCLFFRAVNSLQNDTMRTWFLLMNKQERRGWVESLCPGGTM